MWRKSAHIFCAPKHDNPNKALQINLQRVVLYNCIGRCDSYLPVLCMCENWVEFMLKDVLQTIWASGLVEHSHDGPQRESSKIVKHTMAVWHWVRISRTQLPRSWNWLRDSYHSAFQNGGTETFWNKMAWCWICLCLA